MREHRPTTLFVLILVQLFLTVYLTADSISVRFIKINQSYYRLPIFFVGLIGVAIAVLGTWNLVKLLQTLKEQEEERERFFRVFNFSPSLIAVLAAESGRFIDVNESWSSGTGYTREDILKKSIFDLDLAADGETKKVLQQALSNPSLQNERINFYTKDGTLRSGLLSSGSIKISHEHCKLVMVNDTTTLDKLQKEMLYLERLNLVGEMAAAIAHEVRQPMVSIRGFAQLLGKKSDLSKYDRYFNLIISEIDRANKIITEFLSLTKNKNVEFETACLNEIIEDLYLLIQSDATSQDKRVAVHLGNTPPVLLDRNEVRQLILNLVRNGLEAAAEGGRVDIEIYTEEGAVVLTVKDNGPGIRPEIIELLGQPFVTTKDTGTGLGLTTCYRIVERHNGKIYFETGPDGTTFYVRFPVDNEIDRKA